MNADPTAQLKLLDLQEIDTEIDQIRHRLANLPEERDLADVLGQRTTLAGKVRDQQIVVDDLTAAQNKADRDVEQVKVRRERDRSRLEGGQITDPKALEGLQHEFETLERRITTLEDEELEVMQQLEDAQRHLDDLQSKVAELDQQATALTEIRDARRADLDGQLLVLTGRRDPLVADLPEDLVALYEKVRVSKGGLAAALLRARQCGGCMLTLDNVEVNRIKTLPAEAVARCEECSRILVRTGESGL